jgi:hypothetical protein
LLDNRRRRWRWWLDARFGNNRRLDNCGRARLDDGLYRSGLLANLGFVDRWSFDSRYRDRLYCLDETGRRQHRGRGLRWFCRLLRRRSLLALGYRRLRKDVTARQRNIPLTRKPLDELTRDDFLDRARGAFYLDAMIALQ